MITLPHIRRWVPELPEFQSGGGFVCSSLFSLPLTLLTVLMTLGLGGKCLLWEEASQPPLALLTAPGEPGVTQWQL